MRRLIHYSLSTKFLHFLTLLACGAILLRTHAAQVNITGPAGSSVFGTNVIVLPNGNFIVTDPLYDAPGPVADVGAVYLYNGATLTLISTLSGSTANDKVGSSGITVLSNGNYVVRSTGWNSSRGAVTWCSATTGVSGAVSSANSLVGSTANDGVGNGVTALPNGNYLVTSQNWDNSVTTDVGAVTWCNGTNGRVGLISATNSLVGGMTGDLVGSGGVTLLNNGNYVVSSVNWDRAAVANAGAVTWGSGITGVTGLVSLANSLVGGTASDSIGNNSGLTALNNGNYVVASSSWDNGAVANAGAVTWCNGTNGSTVGAVTSANSLVGSTGNDTVGNYSPTALNNGHYVVRSPNWDNGAINSAGAVTWCSGTTGRSGTISAANSLVGGTASDGVGNGGLIALNNGNYVVGSATWRNGAVVNAGAATWCNGTNGSTVGLISAANSLVGSTVNDTVGGGIALNNGNYVLATSGWDNGALANAGAVTWCNGANGTPVGVISATNSLVGIAANDAIGHRMMALNNGNYVTMSGSWKNGAAASVGAVTWCSGATGRTGAVSAANSLVGNTAADFSGNTDWIPLNNGNYVVWIPGWDNGAVADVGAVTWGNGTNGGPVGVISSTNSLVGSTTGDFIGYGHVFALANDNYVVSSVFWRNGAVTYAGAATWCNGATGRTGAISSANSLVGSTANDTIGYAVALTNGNYVANSFNWDNGAVADAGAIMGDGTAGATGVVASAFSVLGTVASGGNGMVFSFGYLNNHLIAGYPSANRVTVLSFASEITVEQPAGTNLADNAAAIDFGQVSVGASSHLTFIVTNSGNASLILTNITKDGSHPGDFAIGALGSTNLSPAASTTFTVTFTPTALGTRSAAIHITNNDGDEHPFDINLTAASTNTLPVAGTDTYSRGTGTSLKIKIANLITNDSDADLDAIAITGFNLISTNGVTMTTNATYLFYPNGPNLNDKFTYTLTDARGGSVTGAVLVQMLPLATHNTLESLQVGVPGAGTNTLSFVGIPNYQYLEQFATNLSDSPWFNLSTNIAGTNGTWTVLDGTATNAQRFYKVLTP